jgi:hypothetical protein
LRQGDKALVGNKGFRRFLKTEGDNHFALDPAHIAAAAKFDGVYVIRTNAQISPLAVALRYRQRWIVEDIFRTAKSIINTRPICHQRDDTRNSSTVSPPRGVGTNGPTSSAISINSFKPTSIKLEEGFAYAPPLPVTLAPCSKLSAWRCRRRSKSPLNRLLPRILGRPIRKQEKTIRTAHP